MSSRLPASLRDLGRKYHPKPTYEFWFKSEDNAKVFDACPTCYMPAFGGHCTVCPDARRSDSPTRFTTQTRELSDVTVSVAPWPSTELASQAAR
jgi:hypothetical protein